MHQRYLNPTELLDYNEARLKQTREHLLSHLKTPSQHLRALYDFARSLPLGYSRNDNISASEVLRNGFGQCNTKVTLLMALARGAGIQSRLHAYRVHRHVQQERVPAWLLRFAPEATLFFWPEFFIGERWRPLHLLVRERVQTWKGCPFDNARYAHAPLKTDWIAQDDGIWDSPDDYFKKHKPSVHGWRRLGWAILGRRIMNRRARS
jgi:hypothetical protein